MESTDEEEDDHRRTPSFNELALYVALIRNLKPSLAFAQKSRRTAPPEYLLGRYFLFLQAALNLNEASATLWWDSFRDMAWDTRKSTPVDVVALLPLYLEHGLSVGIACYELFPPIRKCNKVQCPNNPLYRAPEALEAPDLAEGIKNKIVLFTFAYGAVPGFSTSTYCRACLTRYHYNCSTSNNVRTYYNNFSEACPQFLQNSTHYFIETELCERFATELTMAWVSAQNFACIYNAGAQAHPWAADFPPTWPVRSKMDDEDVSESFILYSLLKWHNERRTVLQVPHRSPTQAARFHDAIYSWTVAMAGTGQPAWNHACSRCTKIVKDPQGKVTGVFRSVVVDGISLGHPCCAIHDCKEPLPNNKHRFCATHSSLCDECAVEGCHAPAVPPFHTCVIPPHREAEERYRARGKAMFQLKQRLKNIGNTSKNADPPADTEKEPHADNEEEDSSDDEEVLLDENGQTVTIEHCNDKPVGGHCKVFARFGRRRTHNEQLCVASCGVILARATFYGAEGPNSVRLFLKAVFPTQESLPSVIWFDTNCLLSAMLEKDGDNYFDRVALPVDVFHFKSKHKESHGYCGRNCNPAHWPELLDEKTGKWTPNSSAAEQANVWVGGFRAITRVMRADRYNYLLDDVIMRRNEILIMQLKEGGYAPYSIPRDVLIPASELR